MLESSQRIDHLAELARSRLPGLSDPGPPSVLPSPIYDANIFVQIYALLMKTLVYSQPSTMAKFLQKIVVAASLSLWLGAIFWDVAGDSNLHLRDRVGLYYSSLGILFWPLGLLGIREVINVRANVESDIKDGLYGRLIYIILEVNILVMMWKYRVIILCSVLDIFNEITFFIVFMQYSIMVPSLCNVFGTRICNVRSSYGT